MQSKRTDDFAGSTPSLGASSLRAPGREKLPLTPTPLSLPLPPILRTGLAGIALALGLWSASPHAEAAILNGVDFSYIYDGSADPTNPPWTLGLGNGSGTSSGGIFTITTTASENRYYLMTAGSGVPWNATASDGTTVEFRMQVASQASGAG